MTAYIDLCKAFADAEPASIAVHQNVERSPQSMLDAIRRYLDVPDMMVQLYSSLPGRGGNRWAACDSGDALMLDDDGKSAFTIGIMVVPGQVEGSNTWVITSRWIFFALRVEDVGPHYIALGVRNSAHMIRVDDPRNDGAYRDAAASVVNYAIEFLGKQATATKAAFSIGFL